MENAVDALKIAFAILVFIIAIALTFSVISQIRQTSDVLFEASDSNKYYIDDLENVTYLSASEKSNRSVGAETIIPTIYRYYKENFGVTIFTSDLKPIARYDIETESVLPKWRSNPDTINEAHIEYLNKYINPTLLDNNPLNNNTKIWEEYEDINADIIGSKTLAISKLYKMKNNTIATPWLTDKQIQERIKADIYGETISFDSTNTYEGKNLRNYFSDGSKFTEYFIFKPTIKDDGTKDYDKTDKLEIIYVQE